MAEIDEIRVMKQQHLLMLHDNSIDNYYLEIFESLFGSVNSASSLESLEQKYMAKLPDLFIIDIQDESRERLEILEGFRSFNRQIPVVVFSKVHSEKTLLKCLNLSIDAFLSNPTYTQLLEALVNAMKRTAYHDALYGYFDEGVVYNFTTREFRDARGKEIVLGSKENRLWNLLINSHGKVVSRDEIIHYVWENSYASESALKNLISSLRKKIGKNTIVNKSGLGWQIKGTH